MTRIGSLCSGYEGLGMAVSSVMGGEVAWVADIDDGAAKILAHRFPGVPNVGDITAANWHAVEPVDILTAGFPCQDVSCAGARKGLRAGTRTGIWSHVATAIDVLRPRLVFLENVRGLLSAGADSDMESCPWCLGDSGDESALRALGAVLGDLADIGFDAEWQVVSAADAGAPHRRERVFILAWPAADAKAAGEGRRLGTGGGTRRDAPVGIEARTESRHRHGTPAEDADRAVGGQRRLAAPGQAESGRPWADTGRSGGAPATADTAGHITAGNDPVAIDRARDARTGSRAGDRITPADADGGRRGPYEHNDAAGQSDTDRRTAADPPGDGRNAWRPESAGIVRGPDAAVGGNEFCPSCGCAFYFHDAGGFCAGPCGGYCPDIAPGAPADAERGGRDGRPQGAEREPERGTAARRNSPPAAGPGRARLGEHAGEPSAEEAGAVPGDEPAGNRGVRADTDWGPYGAAIRRWEHATGRVAPAPTEPGKTGERLSPRFVEFLMGLPVGWVTDVPGLSRNAKLKALGNGVVPQQAELALRLLLDRADMTVTRVAA